MPIIKRLTDLQQSENRRRIHTTQSHLPKWKIQASGSTLSTHCPLTQHSLQPIILTVGTKHKIPTTITSINENTLLRAKIGQFTSEEIIRTSWNKFKRIIIEKQREITSNTGKCNHLRCLFLFQPIILKKKS